MFYWKVCSICIILLQFGFLRVKSDVEESSEEPDYTEENARKILAELSPKIDSDLKWKFELMLRNVATMSLVEETGTLLDEMEFQNRIEQHKKMMSPYRDAIKDDNDLLRQFNLLREFSCGEKSEKVVEEIANLVEEFESIQDEVHFCIYNNKTNCKSTFNSFLRDEIHNISDIEELKYYWSEWRTKAGLVVRRKYPKLVIDYRKLAGCNGMNASDMYLHPYENDDLMDDLKTAIEDLAPLYNQLHAFTRNSLLTKFNDTSMNDGGLIRDDLLEKSLLDAKTENILLGSMPITIIGTLENETTSALKFLHQADDFFMALNMTGQSKDFWKYFLQEKPLDPECKPEAIALPGNGYAGFKYCRNLNLDNFIGTHYEMAKLQYYENMKTLPVAYRFGLWPGFVNAAATAITLSTSTDSYLQKIGLISNSTIDAETEMASLLSKAINTIFALKLNYVRERIRLEILDEKIDSNSYNTEYWRLMEDLLGIMPPVNRSVYDFDVAIYLQNLNPLQIKEILRIILGYQFYEGLCKISTTSDKQENSLHRCDFSGNSKVGNVLREAMGTGASKSWRDVLKIISGSDKLSSSSILKYFEPLAIWLDRENKKNNVTVGWRKSQVPS